MKIKALLFSLMTLCALALTAGQPPVEHHHNDNRHNEVTYSELPPLRVSGQQGVSGAYAGMAGGKMLVAGGCNFPGVPAARGGEKQFYDTVYLYEDPASVHHRWEVAGHLPRPAAYGVSVTTPQGVVCAGGYDGLHSLSTVCLLNISHGQLQTTTLPQLPVALDNMAGAYGEGYVYVAGGQSDGRASHKAFRLKLQGGKAWEALPDYPGAARLQPAAAMQSDATGPCFYLMGGYAPAEGGKRAEIHRNGLIYNPRTKSWRTTADIIPQGETVPRAISGATCVVSGCAHIVFFGGVNADIFLPAVNRSLDLADAIAAGDSAQAVRLRREAAEYLLHHASWYHFNDELIIYHTLTDTWVTESHSPCLARAGAMAVNAGKEWIIVGGETKPGIRSAEVNAVHMGVRIEFGMLNWLVLLLYLAGMLLLGYYFMKREGSSDDFFKGGGRIPWWAAGISIYATMLSAITYMAIPAKAYATDWTYYPMLVTILIVSFPVIRYYLPFFRRLNVTSAYEYLERRFNYTTRLMASLLFIIFMVARMALVLYLPSLALTTVTGIDIYTCIILMGVITIAYCTMGGVEAVVWGDVVQGIILVGGAIFAMVYLAVNTEGGVGGFFDIAVANDKFRLFDWSFDWTKATFWVVILGGLANNLISYTSDQTVIQRYLTTKDERGAGRSILMNGVMSAFISVAFYAIGTGLYTFFKTHPQELDYTMSNSDAIFPFFMMSQLPSGLAGLLIAAIFAATMSTISSNINSVSTAFSIDVYKKIRPTADDREMLRVARRTCVVAGVIGVVIAVLMATWNILSLLDYFNTILGLLSSGLGGLFVMGIFFPHINARAALIGFVVGTGVVFYLNYLTPVSFLLFGAIGMVVSVAVALLVACFTREERRQDGLTWKTLDKQSQEP